MTTYGQLKTDAAVWLTRDDLTPFFDTAMRLTEAYLSRRLRTRAGETVSTITFTSDTAALPANFLSLVSVTTQDAESPSVDVVDPIVLRTHVVQGLTGQPRRVAVEGLNLLAYPAGTVADPYTLNLTYHARFDTVLTTPADDSNTNWLFTYAYDLMLYAFLSRLGEVLQDEDLEQRYNTKAERCIETLILQENLARSSGGPREMRVRMPEGT